MLGRFLSVQDTAVYDEVVEKVWKSPDAFHKHELLDVLNYTDKEVNPLLLIRVLK